MLTPRIQDISIPIEFGVITDRLEAGPDRPLLVHISDAHCNSQVQGNIAAIGRHLVDTYGFRLFGVEGTDGPISVAGYRRSEAMRRHVEEGLEAGTITGPEWLAVMHAETLSLQGIEDGTVYGRNLEAMKTVMAGSAPALEWLTRLIGAMAELPGPVEIGKARALVALLADGVRFRILRGTYLAYSEALRGLDLDGIVTGIAAHNPRAGDALRQGLEGAKRVAAGVLDFYTTALARDGILFGNAMKAMRRLSFSRAAMVTGGLHVGGIKESALAAGVGTVFIRPQVTWSTIAAGERKYHEIMRRQPS